MDYKPNILAISLGGTLFMADDEVKSAQVLGEEYDVENDFPRINEFCRPEFKELSSIDSSNLVPDDWSRLSDFILKNHEEYDGFVILQGTDTLAYTSSAISFALLGLNKPIVLTGAQKSKEEPGSDAHTNVINAFQVASLSNEKSPIYEPALKEVVIVFGSRIIRGTRARKYSERDLEAFDTVNVPRVGRIRLGIKLNKHAILNHNNNYQASKNTSFNNEVSMVQLYPGIKPSILLDIGKSSSALILAAFGAGNIPCSEENRSENPYSLEPVVRKLTELEIPVVITTQCVTGQAEFNMYEAGDAARRAGAIIANDMTPETAYVKMAWVLNNQSKWPREAKRAAEGGPGWLEGVRKVMISDLAGEVTENPDINSIWEG